MQENEIFPRGVPGIFSLTSYIRSFEVRIVSSAWDKDTFKARLVFAGAGVRMEKTKSVWLKNKFEVVWESLSKRDTGVELETGEVKTKFTAKAVLARSTGKIGVSALVFMKSDSNGKLKECSRCYLEDWGFYFNHLGTEGQRIGMYCLATDCWVAGSMSKNRRN
jgi:hypothetical protein